ncbi:HAD-like protein [Lindgomyces ingoldianus]|uniref:HAD-like protein n=1 Tax=Lindgomyces ingoldianus TaxID=673940 RepID=A0ACB6QCP6_9PLEO|nr:HAD-like protein [Lindgomyces ingoldianus]KAF2464743.1 HAD-like protein [Lindgomyces ingoldianus]
MPSPQWIARKRNLFLAFDAFGTLFTPKAPIEAQYGEIAKRHGIDCPSEKLLKQSFKAAFKEESTKHPNYGKALDMGAETWWENVIKKTFLPFLKQNQQLPQPLISDLWMRFSTKEGYVMYPDVLPFFEMLRHSKALSNSSHSWRWEKTVVGVITNSDDRVPRVLESLGLKIGPRRAGSSALRTERGSLDHDISFVVLSYDVGYEKPDPRMFNAAADMLRATLSDGSADAKTHSIDDFDMLYVGDSVEKDLVGAARAGWDSVFVDRIGAYAKHLEQNQPIGSIHVRTMDSEGNTTRKQIEVIKDLLALSNWPPY